MTEYIEREALMRRIKEIHCAECDSYHGARCRACWVDDTLDYIDSEPAADVEPVVRCRECKHLNVLNRKELYAHCPKTNTVFLPFKLDTREHFCSLGERKEGTDNG